MTNEEIAKLVLSNFAGGKLVDVQAPGGPNPNFVLVFESEDEKRGALTIQAVLVVTTDVISCQSKASINLTIGVYRK